MYKFKSKVTGDVIMLAANGDHILRLMGREPSAKGIVEVVDMPAAIDAIEQAIGIEETERQKAERDAAAVGRALPPVGVTLRQRAWPLLEMLRRCHAAEAVVVWGV